MKITDRRTIGWSAVGLAAVAALAWSLWPRAARVEIVDVALGPISVTLDEEGETRVRERFIVSAPVAGRLLRIELELVSFPQQSPQGRAMREWIVREIRPLTRNAALAGLESLSRPPGPAADASSKTGS